VLREFPAANSPYDIRTSYFLFKIQETRFLVWGQNFNILGPGDALEHLAPIVYETAVQTLIQINELLQKATGVAGHYGLRDLPPVQPPIERNRTVSEGEIRRQATMINRIQKSCSVFQRVCWVVQDRNKFIGMVDILTKFIDALYEFCPTNRREHLTLAVQADELATTLIDQGRPGIQILQQAAQSSTSTTLQRVGELAAFRERGIELRHVEGGNLGYSVSSTCLDIRQLEIFNPTPETGNTRAYGALRDGRRTRVIIEWRTYNPLALGSMLKEDLQRRLDALAQMLSPARTPKCFRTLRCLGHFEDTTAARFGLAFQYPSEWDKPDALEPLSLYQIMTRKDKVPYLGERFALAAFLAESLYEFLVAGWLHKGINAHNILFFRSSTKNIWDGPSGPLSLRDPYFAGFALARPDGSDIQTSRRVPVTAGIALYRHPDVMGLSGGPVARYHPLHDIYSLGLILLEIGTWVRLEKRYMQGSPYQAFRGQIFAAAVPQLGPAMGENYKRAVEKCLTGEFEGMDAFMGNEPDYALNLQRSFFWEVLDVVKKCVV
jgi:Prion-inhibition and propagation